MTVAELAGSATRPRSLADWLAWQETLHPSVIELGLERVARVYRALALPPLPPVITVAGTNGKGSCVAFLEAMLRAAGQRVAAYTSPHLLNYNERLRVDGAALDDEAFCAAFSAVEDARDQVTLTYFEFGTLAALWLAAHANVDVLLLEVGLGGRLDAVNIVDADVAVITSIALDHTEWLGPDRDSIAREKAGIMRAGRAAICADPSPPPALLASASACGARLYRSGRDYRYEIHGDHWEWQGAGVHYRDLPLPAMAGAFQVANAAAAIMALHQLARCSDMMPERGSLCRGLQQAGLAGRCQTLRQHPEVIVDVGHNVHSATALAACLRERALPGQTRVVLAMLADKDVEGFVAALDAVATCWYLAAPACARAADPARLQQAVSRSDREGAARLQLYESVAQACAAAWHDAAPADRVLICGSFYTVAEALPHVRQWVSR